MAGRAFNRPFKVSDPEKRTYKGVCYDSQAECKRAAALDLLKQAGKIAWWLRQAPIDIGEPGVDKPYRVDFLVGVPDTLGCIVVHAEDVKGVDTASFRRHVKQWRKRGPFPLHVIRGKKVEIIPKGVEHGEDEGEAQARAAEAGPGPAGDGAAAADAVPGRRSPRRDRA